ncbi:MAG TPA: YciI family protein [Micromonospora sp.]
MLLIYATAAENPAETTPNGDFEAWMAYDKSVREAGIYVSGEALADLTTATSVRVDAEGRRAVTDGPFVEAREILGGYYVIDVPDLDAALDWAARCPGSWEGGQVVVRPVADFGQG